MIGFQVSIEIESVRMNPGDIVFGDLDGVAVTPGSIKEEVIRLAYEETIGKKMVSRAVRVGIGAKESFDRYRIMQANNCETT